MRLFRRLALGASVLALVLGACSTGGGSASPGSSGGSSGNVTIKIGSDDFDEAKVVAEVYAQALEAAGFKVDRAGIGLGGRKVTAPALESGQLDLKPEYIGSGLTFYGGSYFYLWADNSNSTGDNPDGTLNEFDLYTARVRVA